MRCSTRRATNSAPTAPSAAKKIERKRQRPHHHRPDAAPVAEVMADQEAEAARQHIDSNQRLPGSTAALVAAVEDRHKARMQQHFGGNLLDIAGERLADRVCQQIERRARFALARLDEGAEGVQVPRY